MDSSKSRLSSHCLYLAVCIVPDSYSGISCYINTSERRSFPTLVRKRPTESKFILNTNIHITKIKIKCFPIYYSCRKWQRREAVLSCSNSISVSCAALKRCWGKKYMRTWAENYRKLLLSHRSTLRRFMLVLKAGFQPDGSTLKALW